MLSGLIASTLLVAASALEISASPVEKVSGDYGFTEGPVWSKAHGLLFTDIPKDRIHHADGKIFREPTGKANGLFVDPQGRLIACEHEGRRVSITEADGTIRALTDHFEGKRYNSPNDIDRRSDGTLFFTDPPYGLGDKPSELGYNGVFAILPDGTVKLLNSEFHRPNGLALSADGKKLYVACSGHGYIDVFDVADDATLSNRTRFADDTGPDGIEIGPKGELWVAAKDGVRVYDTTKPLGQNLVLTIAVPEQPANLTLGGAEGKTLYITARKGLYKAEITWGK